MEMLLCGLVQLFIISFLSGLSKSDCPNDIATRDDNYFLLSKNRATFIEAANSCKSSGGTIAQISNNDRILLSNLLVKKYIPENLEQVKILINTANNRNWTIFQVGSSPESPTFQDPNLGELKSIRLYKTSGPNKSRISFCMYPRVNHVRDSIRSACNQGWYLNDALYGLKDNSMNTIKVKHFEYLRGSVTSKLTLNENYNDANYFSSKEIPYIYLPDISIFIGARSGLEQSDWSWNNGSQINSPNFSQSNFSVCQEMRWPLTYDDGINLHPKECETGRSYYICQYKFVAELTTIVCDGTSLLLSWNLTADERFEKVFVEVSSLNNSYQRAMTIPFHQQRQIIGNLDQNTTYAVQLSIVVAECQKLEMRTTAIGTTYFYLPDSVTSASVDNSSSNDCFVVWKYYEPHGKNISFKIIGTFMDISLTFNKEVTSNQPQNNNYRYNIDLSQYDFSSKMFVSFMIQAVSSCGAESLLTEVSGKCQVPSPPSSFPVLYVVVPAACFLLIVGVAISLIVLIRKRRKNENQRNDTRVQENLDSNELASASGGYITLDQSHRPLTHEEHPYEELKLNQNNTYQNIPQTNASTSNSSKTQSNAYVCMH